MAPSGPRRWLLAIALAGPLLVVVPSAAVAASSPIAAGIGDGLQAQVQIPIPNFDFNPTKWVQDAFGALLQGFSDGIRTGWMPSGPRTSSHRHRRP
jgi:hypothetical protein